MADLNRAAAGLLDTSALIDLELLDPARLPERLGISAVTLADLTAGPLAARTPMEQARRQDRLQRAEAAFDPIPFDAEAARAYGRIYAGVVAVGRQPRRRVADLQIAATALANDMSLVTRNAADFVGLERLLEIVAV